MLRVLIKFLHDLIPSDNSFVFHFACLIVEKQRFPAIINPNLGLKLTAWKIQNFVIHRQSPTMSMLYTMLLDSIQYILSSNYYFLSL